MLSRLLNMKLTRPAMLLLAAVVSYSYLNSPPKEAECGPAKIFRVSQDSCFAGSTGLSKLSAQKKMSEEYGLDFPSQLIVHSIRYTIEQSSPGNEPNEKDRPTTIKFKYMNAVADGEKEINAQILIGTGALRNIISSPVIECHTTSEPGSSARCKAFSLCLGARTLQEKEDPIQRPGSAEVKPQFTQNMRPFCPSSVWPF